MTEPLECPACGGKPATVDSLGLAWIRCPSCKMAGPSGETIEAAIAAWNALPRWRWRPAASPPEVPEGRDHVWVMGYGGACDGVAEILYDQAIGFGKPGITHWMPLPPGPDANEVKP